MMPGGLTPIRFRPLDQRAQARSADDGDRAAGLLGVDRGVRRDHRPALRERIGLGDLRLLVDAHRQRSIGHGDGRDLHVLADDDGAGARVEHHARGHVGLNLQFADLRHEARERNAARTEELDGAAVDLECGGSPEAGARIGVDRVDDSAPPWRNRDFSVRASSAAGPARRESPAARSRHWGSARPSGRPATASRPRPGSGIR